jgi:hypothetical protein
VLDLEAGGGGDAADGALGVVVDGGPVEGHGVGGGEGEAEVGEG